MLQVTPDSAAAKAGLEPGDVLVSYGGVELNSMEALNNALLDQASVSEVKLTVWRQGAEELFTRSRKPAGSESC